ncbi:hypothetical protein C7H84_22575 [Burkholderia sp. Nafp2/4-1b]|nr:hypothetical protein C7H84_22575 [Burkholderia sp. Nafp2/4-1b]
MAVRTLPESRQRRDRAGHCPQFSPHRGGNSVTGQRRRTCGGNGMAPVNMLAFSPVASSRRSASL